MTNGVDFKQKYKELKSKFKETVDLAFRLGVEEGLRQSQVQQAQQQQQAAEQAQMAAQQGQPGQPGDPEQQGQPQEDPNQPQQGTELDSHIAELESMLQKMEDKTSDGYISLKKSLDKLQTFQGNQKAKIAINAIGKAMKKPFVLSEKATKNMSVPAKKALNLQEQLVSDIMKGFAEEEKKVAEQIHKTLSLEGILNRE